MMWIRAHRQGRLRRPMHHLSLPMVTPRIPHVTPFPAPKIYPSSATTLPAAIAALSKFLAHHASTKTVILTGAGISVDSGLADYRGKAGTYRLNKSYRPIFFDEFTTKHESRQRYWARSYLGWPAMEQARQNVAHKAVRELWRMGLLSGVVTQNVDSLHHHRHHPGEKGEMEVVELHGTLRSVLCLSCGIKQPRREFQRELQRLNPWWTELLQQNRAKIKTNPDGDVDLPGAEYKNFRYPPCRKCNAHSVPNLKADHDGPYLPPKKPELTGVLKPCVTFFGESIAADARKRADEMVQESAAILAVGTSLATYSAWRLVRDANERGMGLAILNLGGVRGEKDFFMDPENRGRVRLEFGAGEVLKGAVEALGGRISEGQGEGRGPESVVRIAAGLGIGG